LAKADLSSLVRENLGLMKRMVDIKGVSLTVRTPAKPIRAVCDAEKIGQMVTNLVDNALKFTPKGGAIGVDLKRENGGIVLAVSDTGAGIKKEDQRKIFEFLKGDQDKMKKGSGFGIGLFICKSIMEGHRGQIDVQSALGKGATFTATFPANLGPSAPRSEAARRPSGSERKAP
jgi:signal transduction histidine kinase